MLVWYYSVIGTHILQRTKGGGIRGEHIFWTRETVSLIIETSDVAKKRALSSRCYRYRAQCSLWYVFPRQFSCIVCLDAQSFLRYMRLRQMEGNPKALIMAVASILLRYISDSTSGKGWSGWVSSLLMVSCLYSTIIHYLASTLAILSWIAKSLV